MKQIWKQIKKTNMETYDKYFNNNKWQYIYIIEQKHEQHYETYETNMIWTLLTKCETNI